MKKVNLFIISVIAAGFIAGIYFYPQLPEEMTMHWNMRGEADDYMAKVWGILVIPATSLFVFLLYLVVPKIDPLKENIKKFQGYFDRFIAIIVLFLIYLHFLALGWNLGYTFNFSAMMVPALAGLIYYAGVLIENAERNWFIGIRTPWTLSSERVWEKTHKLGAKLFKGAAVLMLPGILFPDLAIYFILVPVIFAAAYSFVYSYVEYRKED